MPKTGPLVELVVPTLNEAHVIEKSVTEIRRYLHEEFPYPARILVADNGSRDGTADIARKLGETWSDVRVYQLDKRGRGRALREAWTHSDADIVAYTDVDISTELQALERICRAIVEDGYHLGTGSRLLRESRVKRGPKREFISRSYNLLVKLILQTHFSDAQCGFKVLSREVVEKVVPQVKDSGWFFDTELLVLAEKQGFRIKDEPVTWIDDDDSRVKIVSTAWEDVKGLFRVRRTLWSPGFRRSRVAPATA
ncbi:MAG: glycosyltransferase family 2 protein [Planctomycetes bacterium]|nr:glycosyltransferase family 2 protein [Planctomycetota bacterium]